MDMKSIRLDFPAAGLSISNHEIIVLLQDALIAAATSGASKGRREAARALAAAVAQADINEYDDRYGGPVFYIP
jgi:hypothetical protein